jgi:hypothetical protein
MIDIKRILCPTDFSQASLSALPYAVEIASWPELSWGRCRRATFLSSPKTATLARE